MKKPYRLLPILIVVFLVLCTGCASKDAYESPAAAPAAMADMAAPQAMEMMGNGMAYSATSNETVPAGDVSMRKIIYNASMSVTADKPELALEEIVAKARALGGYVASSNTNSDDDGPTRCYATIKVPADKLDALVTTVRGTGTVTNYSLNSDDISLNYYDIQARLNNAKAEEAQLLTVLAECTTIEEVLAVRQSLTALRGDIESYQAQINLWDNLVDYATLELNIRRTEQTPVAGEKKLMEIWKASDVWARMKYDFQNSLRFMANAVGAIGIFLSAVAIPAIVLFALVGVPIIISKKRKRQKAALSGETADSAAVTDRKAARAARKAEKEARKQAQKARRAEQKARKGFGHKQDIDKQE